MKHGPPLHRSIRTLILSASVLTLLPLSPELHAQIVWDRGASTDVLTTAANWSGDLVPASTSAAAAGRQDATFDGSVTGTLNLTFAAAFGGGFGVGLVMTAGQTSAVNIANSAGTAQTLRIVNSTAATVGGIQIASGAGALTIGAAGTANPITLALGQGASALNYYFANNSANTATIEENVTITKGGSHAASLIFSAGTWDVKGIVSNLGAGGLNVNAGIVTLSGNNDFGTAALNVNGGTLQFSALNNLGTGTSAVRLGQTTTNGKLVFTGASDTTISRLMRIGNGAATGQTGGAIIDNNGAGVLTFDNATFNEVGTTAAGVNRTLTVGGNNTGNNTISGVIANNNPGNVAINKTGIGKWVLSGNNTYTGGATVSEGTLVVGHDNALGNGTISLRADASGEVARLQSNGTDRTFVNVVSFGGADPGVNYLGGAGTGNLTFSGDVGWGSGSKTYTIDGSTVTFSGNFTGDSSTAVNTIDGTDTATSIVILNGDRGTAAKEISIGNNVTVRANHANSFGSDNTEPLNILGGVRVGVVELTNDITLARTLTVQGRSTDAVALRNLSGNNSLAISVGAGGTSYNIESTAGNLTISAISGSTGARDLLVTGAGNVTLPNWNTRRDLTMNGTGTLTMGGSVTSLSGTATVNSGTLFLNAVGGVGALSATGGLVINSGGTVVTTGGGNSIGTTTAVTVNTGGLLDIRKNNTIGALSGGGTVRHTTATDYTLTVNNDNGNSTFSGVMEQSSTGKLGLIKNGTGTLTLTGANTYTGNTTVTSGSLEVNNTSGSGTGSGTVTTASSTILGGTGTLSPTGGNAITIGGSLAPGSPDTNSGVGTLTFTPASADATLTATSTADFQLLSNGLHGYTAAYNGDGTLASLSGSYTGGGNDRLVFNGGSAASKLDLTSLASGNFNITFASGYTPAANDLFDLLDWTNLTGSGSLNNEASAISGLSLGQLDLPSLSGGLSWDTSFWVSHGVIGIYIVPEPSRALLMLAGLSALMLRRRRSA
jgi:fibronectin-binding autotransporter adhesin